MAAKTVHPTEAWTSNQRADMETKSNSRSLRVHPKKRQEQIFGAKVYARRIPVTKQQRLLKKCHSRWDIGITMKSIKRPNSLPCIPCIFHLVKIQFTRHHPVNDVCGKIRQPMPIICVRSATRQHLLTRCILLGRINCMDLSAV